MQATPLQCLLTQANRCVNNLIYSPRHLSVSTQSHFTSIKFNGMRSNLCDVCSHFWIGFLCALRIFADGCLFYLSFDKCSMESWLLIVEQKSAKWYWTHSYSMGSVNIGLPICAKHRKLQNNPIKSQERDQPHIRVHRTAIAQNQK